MRAYIGSGRRQNLTGITYNDFYIIDSSLRSAFNRVKKVYLDVDYLKEVSYFPEKVEVNVPLTCFEFKLDTFADSDTIIVLAESDEQAFDLIEAGTDREPIWFYKIDDDINPF